MDKKKLYKKIDEEDDMTDQEKRDSYQSEVAENEGRESWENGYH